MKSTLLLLCASLFAFCLANAQTIPPHPRLLVTDADWKNLPAKMEQNPIIKNIVTTTIARADITLTKPPLTRTLTGRRLLSVSRDAVQYIIDLSAAYKITNDKKYLTRATAELLSICAFSDWHPIHHLDTAEMQTAVAIGYDWLYHDLSPTDRETISSALLKKGLQSTLENNYVFTRKNNWNQVCIGGITLSAIALNELYPDDSKKALDLVIKSIPIGLIDGYPADGAYSEGGGYWQYGTEYSILTHEAFRTAALPDPAITSHPGFMKSADFLCQVYGTSGLLFNYGDNKERKISATPAAAWMARETKIPHLLNLISPPFQKNDPEKLSRFHILAAFWFPEKNNPESNELPTHFIGTGKSPIAIHRTGFQSTDLFLGIKAGMAKVNHGHMDAGSFVIDWEGQRWANDLGPQDYHSIEKTGIDLFSMTQDSKRWTSYRLNNFSHNNLTYNEQLHDVSGEAKIISSTGSPNHKTILDLTEALNLPKNATAIRTFELIETTPPSITITDEIKNLKPNDKITWNMLTHAKVKKSNDHSYVLTQNKNQLTLTLSSPQAYSSTQTPAIPPREHDEPTPNHTQINLIAKPDKTNSIHIKATFQMN